MRILLIDDCRDIESYAGCYDDALVARNYKDGIDMLKLGNFDVLYLDYHLGSCSKNGMCILDFLSENPQFIPKKIEVVSDFSADIVSEMKRKIEVLMMLKKQI